MYKYVGYVWPGMLRITAEEARKIIGDGGTVYRLYLDNTEGAVGTTDDVEDTGEYGVECDRFSFENYLDANQDQDGFVYFSHGTDSVDDLLELAKEFMECVRPSLRPALQDALDSLLLRIEKYLPDGEDAVKQCIWRCAQTFIDGVTPMGWKFGLFAGNEVDYVFTKEQRTMA